MAAVVPCRVWIMNILPIPCIILGITLLQILPSTLAQESGFLSIDCGSSATAKYVNPSTTIQWQPDAVLWPEIGNWSATASVSPPASMAYETQYGTLRYFPTTTTKALNQSKFCFTLPATAGDYYLIRASFWLGKKLLYPTRVSGQIRFRVIVDSYEGVEIVINVPQKLPWFEEMYIPAQSGRSSVSVCLSTASDSSDVPFINSLELRPLPSTMKPVETVKNTNYALRTVWREDSGTESTVPSILRYPSDAIDRFWWRFDDSNAITYSSNNTVAKGNSYDFPPLAVMRTNLINDTIIINPSTRGASSSSDVLTASTLYGSHYYFMVLWFVELNPNVNASGKRVFNVAINDKVFNNEIDIYRSVGANTALEVYSPTDRSLGPYEDRFVIQVDDFYESNYYASLAAAEILQLFDNPMNSATSSSDILAIQDLITSSLPAWQRFLGDPCLPLPYKYSWINCDYANQNLAARVTSISLPNYGLVGTLASSINNLDELVTLDLSNNFLSGEIPDSLSKLPKLTYLNLANNNFSGKIPPTLLQKPGLVFRYYGNPNLIEPSVTKKTNIGLIIGASVGAILFIILAATILYIVVWRNLSQTKKSRELQIVQPPIDVPSTPVYPDPSVNVRNEEHIKATNVAKEFTFEEIKTATNNFSELLGKGGFGLVYKGYLSVGLDVAVKVLSDASKQGPHEFLNEVTLLSRVHHKNLVGFVGYSIEKSLILVYEFMANGSLYDALSRRKTSPNLSWRQRLQILFDAAQGLAYLHHGCNIIHRDVKSSNILLSQNLEGKMSDFGISRITHNDINPVTRVVGTTGYLDPAYAYTSILTEKVDIYGFGVVLLEAICGRRPIIKDKTQKIDIHIVEWVKSSYENGMIEEVIDQRLDNYYNASSIWKVVEIAMACVQFEAAKRPTMADICNGLAEAIRIGENSEFSSKVTEETLSYSNVQPR